MNTFEQLNDYLGELLEKRDNADQQHKRFWQSKIDNIIKKLEDYN